MASTRAIGCVEILGPDNSPILIYKAMNESQDFEMDTIVFCSLDHFEGHAQQRRATLRASDRLIGPLPLPESRFQTWGYRASLGYKIVVLALAAVGLTDAPIRQLCDRVKDALFDCIMDPFYAPFSSIESEPTLQKIKESADAVPLPQV
jgi:hypothetical protein